MKNTLFSKMLLTYLMVTLALLILLGVTASAVFVQHYIFERELELRREGSEIIAVITDKYMDSEKRNVATEELVTIARKYDGLIQIKFNDKRYGYVSVANTNTENSQNNATATETVTKWDLLSYFFDYIDGIDVGNDGEATISDAFEPITDIRTMTLAMPVKYQSENAGMLCFTIDMTDTYDVIGRVVIDVVIFCAFGVVLAFLAVLYITERITRPIVAMTKTVRRFTKGDYDARIAYQSEDEVGELAKSFNKMADEVNTLEEARRSFVANVSHELRSPLASMRGFLVAMQDGTIAVDSYDKYLTVVIDENKRMTEIVNDLLDMARIESGGDKALVMEAFDITEVIRTTVITFEARITQKHIDMDISLGERQIFVWADRGQIIHVLRNLIDNAIKFTPEDGVLSISVLEKRQEVWVTVKDSGPGIADEDLPHIFDRFYKAEKAHTRSNTSGTGLGLAIAKRIIDTHEQNIYVVNDNGACFMFSLKRATKPKKSPKTVLPTAGIARTTATKPTLETQGEAEKTVVGMQGEPTKAADARSDVKIYVQSEKKRVDADAQGGASAKSKENTKTDENGDIE